jgi:hypothetical protein
MSFGGNGDTDFQLAILDHRDPGLACQNTGSSFLISSGQLSRHTHTESIMVFGHFGRLFPSADQVTPRSLRQYFNPIARLILLVPVSVSAQLGLIPTHIMRICTLCFAIAVTSIGLAAVRMALILKNALALPSAIFLGN